MDVYDDMMPRHAPQPVPFIEVTAKPTVPEVSLLFDQEKSNHASTNRSFVNKTPECNKPQEKSNTNVDATPTEPYNVWRFKTMPRQNGFVENGPEVKQLPTRFVNQEKDLMGGNSYKQSRSRPQQNYGTVEQGNSHYSTEPTNQFKQGFSDPLLQGYREFKNRFLQDGPEMKNQLLHRQSEFNHLPKDVTTANINQETLANHVRHSRNMHETIPSIRNNGPSHTHVKTVSEFAGKYQRRPEFNRYGLQHNHSTPDYHDNHYHSRNDQITRDVYRPSEGSEHNQCCSNGCNYQLHNYRTSNPTNIQCYDPHNFNKSHSCDRIPDRCSSNPYACKPDGDSTLADQFENQNFIKEMINIIRTQNDQISKLQDQIKQLIQLHSDCYKVKDSTDKVMSGSPKVNARKIKRTQSYASDNLSVIEETSDTDSPVQDRNSHNLSVGMKANVEKTHSDKLNSSKNCYNCERQNAQPPPTTVDTGRKKPSIQQYNTINKQSPSRNERPSVRGSRQGLDQSFTLNEADLAIGTITEQIPSPTSSVHVDMHEYNSSSSDNSEDSEDSEESNEARSSPEPQVSWTFYNNVVGQVNNILKKKPITKPPPDSLDSVRHLTIEQLRKMGIIISDVDNTISKKVTFDAKNVPYNELDDKNETDITMHFNSLGLQYLNDDCRNKYPDKNPDFRKYNLGNGNTSLSFATLHFLERHHLLPNDQDVLRHQLPSTSKDPYVQKKKKTKRRTKDTEVKKKTRDTEMKKKTSRNSVPSKILDITTLKQQPKLL